MKLKIEKVVTGNCEKKYRIVGFSGILPSEKLPEKYLNMDKYVFAYISRNALYLGGNGGTTELPCQVDERGLAELVKFLQVCSTNLKQVRAKIKSQEDIWNGTETITISGEDTSPKTQRILLRDIEGKVRPIIKADDGHMFYHGNIYSHIAPDGYHKEELIKACNVLEEELQNYELDKNETIEEQKRKGWVVKDEI